MHHELAQRNRRRADAMFAEFKTNLAKGDPDPYKWRGFISDNDMVGITDG